MSKENNLNLLGFIALFLIGLIIGQFFMYQGHIISMENMHHEMHEEIEQNDSGINDMSIDSMRTDFMKTKNSIISELISKGDYMCCLQKPCTYCIEKTPGHGEGAKCTCLEDVMNGLHPCGECIGEIMEGHGNKFLAPYFSEAISEEMGIEHKKEIMQMMSEKYGVSVEDQI